ncbi:MAG: spore coat protein CotJB [Clostridia bacterium]|nr:spore coat protein CotJB [Clostridia bacterium]
MESILKEKLLKLQEIDFVLADLKLYLDTHPCDTAMLMKYCMYAQKSMMLRNEIETRYRYPLTAKAAAAFGPRFGWINSPWPWCGKDPKAIDATFNPCQAGSMENDCTCTCTCECEKETEVCN